MSRAEKLILWGAFIGALVVAVFGYLVVDQKKVAIAERDQAMTTLESAKVEIKQLKDAVEAKNKAVADAEKKASESVSKTEQLTKSLTEAQDKSASLETSLKETTEKLAAAEEAVKKISEAFQGKSPEEIKAAALAAENELAEIKNTKKILEDQIQSSNAEIQRLTEALRRGAKGEMPPGLSGKIQNVNKQWNFVVLNMGDKDGVVRNGVFVVYRGNQYVGRVKVVSTEANTAVADILSDTLKGEIMIGDDALN
jgi:vacuolar-type H+-ATPase subunit I/STV1